MLARAGRYLAPLAVAAAVVIGASGCSEGVTLPDDADEELVLGHEVYRQRCARCHGASGGGGLGPGLAGIEDRLDDAGQLDVVVNGRKAMPRFDSTLTESEIRAVVRYTREIF